jgi:hypothetical protein
MSSRSVIDLFVNYTIEAKHYQAGPYIACASPNCAQPPGVSNTWLGRSRFYYRKLIVRLA